MTTTLKPFYKQPCFMALYLIAGVISEVHVPFQCLSLMFDLRSRRENSMGAADLFWRRTHALSTSRFLCPGEIFFSAVIQKNRSTVPFFSPHQWWTRTSVNNSIIWFDELECSNPKIEIIPIWQKCITQFEIRFLEGLKLMLLTSHLMNFY